MKRLTAALTVAVLVLWGATALVAADLPPGLQGVLTPDQALTDAEMQQLRGTDFGSGLRTALDATLATTNTVLADILAVLRFKIHHAHPH